METKHTPGRWRVAEDANENLFGDAISIDILDERDFPIASVEAAPVIHNWPSKFPNMQHWADGAADGRTQIERPRAEVIANACRIAAAPEMLEALQKIPQRYMDDMDIHTPGAAQLIRAAIAKATKEPA